MAPYEWLRHYPRYLRAAEARLEKLMNAGAARDERQAAELAPWWRAYIETADRRRPADPPDPALERFRWMLEEMRVSLFAQELRTSIPVSSARLEKAWAEVQG